MKQLSGIRASRFILLAVWLGGCSEHLVPISTSPGYETARFKRKNRQSPPILFGQIDQKERDGRIYPVKIASVVVDDVVTSSEPNGYYSRSLMPGNHRVAIKWLGLKSVVINQLVLQQGDSIRINFHLATDTTTFRN